MSILKKLSVFYVFFALILTSNNLINAQETEQVRTSSIEEIIVTARQRAETLQDVPVTVAVLGQQDLERYNITNLVDAGKMVPNLQIAQGASGNGSNIKLRGIGSSSISAAFDQSVAINIDGVVVNRGRFIHNSYLDMSQLEILKGPQSLYFGKSATAGVISVTSNDPTDEFEFEIAAGIESEHEGTFAEMIISGPLSDNFGARLAIGVSENEELIQNYSYANDPMPYGNGTTPWFGDESTNARLTLVWEPTENFSAKLKYTMSEYESDGGNMWYEEYCPEGAHQATGIPSGGSPFTTRQGVDDCTFNGNGSRINLEPGLRDGLPMGFDNGVPGLEQETDMVGLTLTYDINDSLTLTSVTSTVELDHWELDDYSQGAGVFGGLHNNIYEHTSQEFRLASDYDSSINFQIGVYWQEIEQEFDAYQYAFNLPIMPNIFGPVLAAFGDFDPASTIVGPDPATGNMYDYNKHHFLDTDVLSAFLALYWDVNDRTEVTIGARLTEEEKVGRIEIPYIHAAAAAFGFAAPPLIEGLEFEDDNISPEFAVNYYVNDDVSVYFSYKEGFKSGGIDNSALPTASINPLSPTFEGFGALIYDSEESEGFEIGMKGNFLDGNLRLNATAYSYEFSDLQVQIFNATIIQFSTYNASALETEGLEFDLLWNTNIEGLTVRSAWALTDATYSEDNILPTGENLKGEDATGSADMAGYIGFTYDQSLTNGWRSSISGDARYTGEYSWVQQLNPYMQDEYWLMDASLRVYSEDGHHSFDLIGRNLGDEIVCVTGASIPGRIAQDASSSLNLDHGCVTTLGRTLTFKYRYRM